MLCRLVDQTLEVRELAGTRQWAIPVGDLACILACVLSPNRKRLALCAVSAGRPVPNPLRDAPHRGERRLYVIELASGERRLLPPKYGQDPAWFPDSSRLAYYNGRGLCSIAADGTGDREHLKLGQFSWGPPSVSVSPGGLRIGGRKWKGDSAFLAVADVAGDHGKVLPVSCYHYSWLDDARLFHCLGNGIRICDASSGRTTQFLRDVPSALAVEVCDQRGPDLDLLRDAARAAELGEVSDPLVHAGRVYFLAWVTGAKDMVHAVLSVDVDRTGLVCHALVQSVRPPGRSSRINALALLNGGRTVAVRVEESVRLKTVHQEWQYFGEYAESTPLGWAPLASIPSPEFGFVLH